MRKLVLLSLLCLGLSPVVHAEDAPAVLNEPSEAVTLTKAVINKLQPSYETVIDVLNGDVYQGISGALYTFESREIPIASVRLGASTGMAMYSGVSLDLPGITQRFLPQPVKDPVTVTPLDSVWSVVGKYARVGVVGGYSWDHHDPIFGMTAGASLTF